MSNPLAQPLDGNGQVIKSLAWDGVNHQFVIPQASAGVSDPTGQILYAPALLRIVDGQSSLLVNVVAFHNGDNQSLSGTGGSILTSGVAQILNAIGNGDRQRETGLDQVGSQGVTMGSQMFAQFFKTSVPTTGTITAGATSATITPASMNGMLVGSVLLLDAGANAEAAVITAVTSTTATIIPTNGAPLTPTFKFNHTPSYQVTGFLFNQERDASGENSGASGKGTAVAAEYEFVSGGPPLANGTPSLLQYDREVAALGKVGANSGAGFAITSTTAGNTSLTPTTPANFAALTPGQWIRLSGSGTNEYVRVDDSYIIAAAPATIPLSNAVVNTGQTTATFDTFGANGPGQNPVLWTGEGYEGVLLNDPTKPGQGRVLQGNAAGEAAVTTGGLNATSIAAGVTADTVIKAAPGRIARILVTTTGTNPLQVFDNASGHTGTIIAALPASPAIGPYEFQFPAANGITVFGNAANPAVTMSWS